MVSMMRCRNTFRTVLLGISAVIVARGVAAAAPLTLDEAISRAIIHAPVVASAAASAELSNARVNEQRAPMMPSKKLLCTTTEAQWKRAA